MNFKITLLLTIIAFCCSNTTKSQQFVNESNLWYLTDCCFSQGVLNCKTHEYFFDEIVVIDTVSYYKLNSSRSNFIGQFYREENGVVYKKFNEDLEEAIIYDFNLEEGDSLEIGNDWFPLLIEVLSVDSVTLISGEKRKRLEIAEASNINSKTYWVEGIGAELSTMDPVFMFSLDCWNDFNCYHFEDNIEYQLGNCMLTSSEDLNLAENLFSSYPNPIKAGFDLHLLLAPSFKGRFALYDLTGREIHNQAIVNQEGSAKVKIPSSLSSGVYFYKLEGDKGTISAKIVVE
ncbi:MAG: hypothetical protein ACI9VN_003074 [Patescibacteria group bacterium]|jgi:hypothetical protein